jgi:hypothetical protein
MALNALGCHSVVGQILVKFLVTLSLSQNISSLRTCSSLCCYCISSNWDFFRLLDRSYRMFESRVNRAADFVGLNMLAGPLALLCLSWWTAWETIEEKLFGKLPRKGWATISCSLPCSRTTIAHREGRLSFRAAYSLLHFDSLLPQSLSLFIV